MQQSLRFNYCVAYCCSKIPFKDIFIGFRIHRRSCRATLFFDECRVLNVESHCKFSVNQEYKIQQDLVKWRHNVEKFDNHITETLVTRMYFLFGKCSKSVQY